MLMSLICFPNDIIRLLARAAFFVCAATSAFAGEAFVDRFEDGGDGDIWRTSDYHNPARWIDTRWSPKALDWRDGGGVSIHLTPDDTGIKAFRSGEMRTGRLTHYGRYEVVMQAAAGDGLNSAFFTYTGPHRDERHDEIDFEFLGRDTSKVWLNYYVDGDAQLSLLADLGFDAAAGAHRYAFEWTETSIRWFVDDVLLHEISTPSDPPPPTTPGQIYISLWAGHPSIRDWLKTPDPATHATARFECVSYTPDLPAQPACW
ncbi:MAG: family 16 glycosylhydrolase [Pseudomonadota bacterium]